MIWCLNIWQCSMWCSNSSFNLLISDACQMQPWVSLFTFPMILCISRLKSLYCHVPWIKKDLYIRNSVVWRCAGNFMNHMRFGTYLDEITEHIVCFVWHWSARSNWETGGMVLEYVLGMLYLFIYNLDILKLSMSKQACNSYGLYLKLLSSTILVYCVL